MPRDIGTRLGPCEIAAPIGAGGMGEVHKASDTRLNRTVAIKVIQPYWEGRPGMKERFDELGFRAQEVAAREVTLSRAWS